ncbi:MAG TPA: MmcQ/YjbR family DNA-binding protein [Thermoanaerobaculia bacterium]|nr:MmcQ/YjbR family DNA-binding protein [Thermoanaerobaculia bacterium]
MPVTFADVRQIALALPEVEEGKSYGTPAFKVRGKFLSRLREDGETLVVRIDMDERDILMAANPETFYITDHYRGYPAMLVRMATVDPDELRELLEGAWRRVAPKRLVAVLDQGPPAASKKPS